MSTNVRSDYRVKAGVFIFVFSLLTLVSIGLQSVLYSFVFGSLTSWAIYLWVKSERLDEKDLEKESTKRFLSNEWAEKSQSEYIGIDTPYKH